MMREIDLTGYMDEAREWVYANCAELDDVAFEAKALEVAREIAEIAEGALAELELPMAARKMWA